MRRFARVLQNACVMRTVRNHLPCRWTSARGLPAVLRTVRVAAAATLCMSFAGVAAELQAQQASVTGAVLIDGNDRPLANAEILLTDLNVSTRTNGEGKFLLNGLPAGKHSLLVRLVGYESFTADITLGASQKLDADYLLTPVSTKLRKVDVKANPSAPYAIKLAEFEERRHTGIGKFLTADLFEHEDGRPPSSFLRAHIAGINFIQSNGHRYLASMRGPGSVRGYADPPPPQACYVQIILNGVVTFNGSPGQGMFDFDYLNSKDIIGFEYYSSATAPLQYRSSAGAVPCGTAIIWTKGG